MSRAQRGLWITFEGIEGCGKTTQLARLARSLAGRDPRPVRVTREPGGTELGRRIRAWLLDPAAAGTEPVAELLLYAADRAQHLTEVVIPALDAGEIVLCDRFLDATLAYQGYGRRLGTARVLELHRLAPLDRRPDRTVLLDLEVEAGLDRARQRNRVGGSAGTEGRFEEETLDFHRRVRRGYLELAAAHPERIRTVDAGGDEDAVAARVRDALRDLLPCLAGHGGEP